MRPKMFDLARKISLKSTSKFKLGCVIARRNNVLAVGINDMCKTHPKAPHPFKMLHAEIDAILGLTREETEGAVAYVYRSNKDGLPVNAKPCVYCQAALKRAGIKFAYYTHEEGSKVLEL